MKKILFLLLILLSLNSCEFCKRLRVDVGRWGNKSSGLCCCQRPHFEFKRPSAPRALDKGFQGFSFGHLACGLTALGKVLLLF